MFPGVSSWLAKAWGNSCWAPRVCSRRISSTATTSTTALFRTLRMAARTCSAFREPAVNRESSLLRSALLETIICHSQSFKCDGENRKIDRRGVTSKWPCTGRRRWWTTSRALKEWQSGWIGCMYTLESAWKTKYVSERKHRHSTCADWQLGIKEILHACPIQTCSECCFTYTRKQTKELWTVQMFMVLRESDFNPFGCQSILSIENLVSPRFFAPSQSLKANCSSTDEEFSISKFCDVHEM